MENLDLRTVVDRAAAGVANESLDLSVSEIINLHKNGDLIISPAFQRLFRWENEQQSRLIESLLLGLPIPQIFLFQREDGVLELVDGLQRVSSMIRFVEPESLGESGNEKHKTPLRLEGCDLVSQLNGLEFATLPPATRREFLRKAVRAIIIRRTNAPTLRYEMFKRLNSGGSPAEYQEIRNAQIRILGVEGAQFLEFIEQCSNRNSFHITTDTLADALVEKQGRQELVLRFYAGLLRRDSFRGNVAEWIDGLTEAILITRELAFDQPKVKHVFDKTFDLIEEKLGRFAFVKYRDLSPIGGLAPAYFEAVSLSVADDPEILQQLKPEEAKRALALAVEAPDFRLVTGSGANSLPKLKERIDIIRQAFLNGKNV